MINSPLVSIGLPAYNREKLIGRAIESALGQDYKNIELIISDNASTDGTEAICRAYAARDARLRYFRQPVNRGGTANFNTVFNEARGEYFLWLGDDDWFDLNYVSSCVRWLEEHSHYVLAYGCAHYYQGEAFDYQRPGFSLEQEKGTSRVRAYYQLVDDNAMFYGVMRHANLANAMPLRNVVGGDWLLMAVLAYQGKVQVLDETRIHRTLGGASSSYRNILKTLGQPAFYAPIFMLVLGLEAHRDLMRSPAYAPLSWAGRFTLSLRCQPWFVRQHLRALKGRSGEAVFALSKSSLTRPLYEVLRQSFRLLRRFVKRS
ncbi:MAG TPA: glycosyltransferase family 2 protein [Abditibacteriaceae bacterium]|jgi:glycosyltransferase involved in cell wall biosynthesis